VPEHGVPKSSKEAEIVVLRPEDAELFVRLKTLRKSIADRDGVPPYVIFPDKSLREMARVLPCDEDQFRIISGVGEYKLKKYGADFISAIKNGM
jgi:ATP-dependent DNA helicase RecQ